MTKKLSALTIMLGIAALALASVIGIAQWSLGASQTDNRSVESSRYKTYEFFSATTTNATSTTDGTNGFQILGAERVNLFFTRGDATGEGNTGTTTFKVQVTDDGETWQDYPHLWLVETETTADGYYTRVSSANAGASESNDHAATSTSIYRMDTLGFRAVRCIAVEEVDGEHTCTATAEF